MMEGGDEGERIIESRNECEVSKEKEKRKGK